MQMVYYMDYILHIVYAIVYNDYNILLYMASIWISV